MATTANKPDNGQARGAKKLGESAENLHFLYLPARLSVVASGNVAGWVSMGNAGFCGSSRRRLPGAFLAERKGNNEKKSLHAN
jgi:hypothetical protein